MPNGFEAFMGVGQDIEEEMPEVGMWGRAQAPTMQEQMGAFVMPAFLEQYEQMYPEFEQEIDWRECWQHGYDFVLQHYPDIVDDWLVRQKVDGNIIVFDPWLRENVTIVEGYENGTI